MCNGQFFGLPLFQDITFIMPVKCGCAADIINYSQKRNYSNSFSKHDHINIFVLYRVDGGGS